MKIFCCLFGDIFGHLERLQGESFRLKVKTQTVNEEVHERGDEQKLQVIGNFLSQVNR